MIRSLSWACTAGLTLAMAGCAGSPTTSAGRYPATVGASAPMSLEFGRITGIEYVPAGAAAVGQPNLIGAVVGGAVGAVLGHQIGGGSGRDAATVLGGVAGAVVGSQMGREPAITATTSPTYRVSVRVDPGVIRTYEVPATGELQVGDQVRIENNVIYRL